MKRARRLFALLLTLAMVLTYMPLTSYAAAKDEPVSIEFTAVEPLVGTAGTSLVSNFDREGNTVTVNYSGGKVEKYICKETEDEIGYFLNGNISNGRYEDIGCEVRGNGRLVEGTQKVDVYFWYNTNEGWEQITTEAEVTAAKSDIVKAVSYKQKAPVDISYRNYRDYGIFGQNYLERMAGDQITVTQKYIVWDEEEETEKQLEGTATYECKKDGDEYYFKRISGPEEMDDTLWPDFYEDEGPFYPMTKSKVIASVEGVDAPEKLIYNISGTKAVPVKAELVLASGFKPDVYIGMDYIDEYAFFGKGNKINVTYSDGSAKSYVYTEKHTSKVWYEGFYPNGNTKKEPAYFYQDIDGGLKKGETTLELNYNEYFEEYEDSFNVPFEVTVKADKKRAFVAYLTYNYTGKVIKPKVIVTSSTGEKLKNKTDFTYKAPKNKKIGFYSFKVKLKDKNTFEETAWCDYSIAPKGVSIKSLKAGKKSFTVKWKKPSKKDLKVTTGYLIEYSDNKYFYDSSSVKVKKSATSKVIKGLKKGKTYYVRIYSYNKSKKYGNVTSNPSKAKKVKVK